MANQNQEKNHTEPNKTQSKTSKLLEARENASNQPVIGLAMHLIGWIESATFSGSITEQGAVKSKYLLYFIYTFSIYFIRITFDIRFNITLRIKTNWMSVEYLPRWLCRSSNYKGTMIVSSWWHEIPENKNSSYFWYCPLYIHR